LIHIHVYEQCFWEYPLGTCFYCYLHYLPRTNNQHLFVTYLSILENKVQQQFQIHFLKTFNNWEIGMQKYTLISCICNNNPMDFDFQQFWQISNQDWLQNPSNIEWSKH
jgi:hypothetical protein